MKTHLLRGLALTAALATHAADVRLSTGTTYRSKGVRYTFKVEDEAADAPDALRRLMRVAPDMPIGDGLQAQWKADRAGLVRRACGTADAAS